MESHVRTLASRSNRLIGQFIDGVIGMAPFILGAVVSAVSDVLGTILIFAAAAWAFFYYFFADGLHGGQSYAKRWLGMQVIDEKTGAPCGYGQSFIRNLLLFFLGPLDWIFIFGGKHQRLGDKAARTIVIAD